MRTPLAELNSLRTVARSAFRRRWNESRPRRTTTTLVNWSRREYGLDVIEEQTSRRAAPPNQKMRDATLFVASRCVSRALSSCLPSKETARIHARRFSRAAQPLSDGVGRMMMMVSPRAYSYVLRQAARLRRRVLRGDSCQSLVLEHASGHARNDLPRCRG